MEANDKLTFTCIRTRNNAMAIGTRVANEKVRLWLCVKLVINIYFLNMECCVFIKYKKET